MDRPWEEPSAEIIPWPELLATFDWANVQLGWGFDDVYPAA